MTQSSAPDLVQRKADHLDIVMRKDVSFGPLTTGFEHIQFLHNALPELSLADIDISTEAWGRSLKAPLLISSMTGGPAAAHKINAHLAEAAEALGIAFAVGSQRVAVETVGDGGLDRELRALAPSVPIIGNIGAAQLLEGDAATLSRRAIDMIEADALYVHLNPLQEAVQSGGDTNWSGILNAIESLINAGLPIAIKEVGFGLSAPVIERLLNIGVTTIDVAGAGGTNWARVEGYRHGHDEAPDPIAEAFTDWGIPTAQAVVDARRVAPTAMIIASGGVRDGIDAAKAIRLGANLAGQAAGTLAAALESTQSVVEHFERLIETLKIVCFTTGSKDLAALSSAALLNSGRGFQATNL